ncbi:MAG TPA: PHP domain-containing protein, partial [Elusimicrobiota bacterium]|nr:PHP domain-containing protein [Elusimicrobiota bacterium]
MGRVDLHCHSTYSDGTLAPAEVVRRAKAKNIEFLVLSDHDSVSGYPEAREAGEKLGVKVFCGIEINTREDGQVHVLGYGIDWRSEALARRLAEFRERRRRRASLILEKLRGAGIDIADSDLDGVSKESLGRPHVADALKR